MKQDFFVTPLCRGQNRHGSAFPFCKVLYKHFNLCYTMYTLYTI